MNLGQIVIMASREQPQNPLWNLAECFAELFQNLSFYLYFNNMHKDSFWNSGFLNLKTQAPTCS